MIKVMLQSTTIYAYKLMIDYNPGGFSKNRSNRELNETISFISFLTFHPNQTVQVVQCPSVSFKFMIINTFA